MPLEVFFLLFVSQTDKYFQGFSLYIFLALFKNPLRQHVDQDVTVKSSTLNNQFYFGCCLMDNSASFSIVNSVFLCPFGEICDHRPKVELGCKACQLAGLSRIRSQQQLSGPRSLVWHVPCRGTGHLRIEPGSFQAQLRILRCDVVVALSRYFIPKPLFPTHQQRWRHFLCLE